jgi:predicted HAD superfamily Cof-like phosphohydrolase
MNRQWEEVKEFHEKFNHPVSETPVYLSRDRVNKRYDWMKEEIDEFADAPDIYEQADAMIDLIYFALGTLVEMGIKPDKLFNIVQNANMSKLWPDGKPRYKEDGKVMKSKDWVDPYPLLKKEIDSLLYKNEVVEQA